MEEKELRGSMSDSKGVSKDEEEEVEVEKEIGEMDG